MRRRDLPKLLRSVLAELGGSGTILEICKKSWAENEDELKSSGDLFYTWQYDIRWAAHKLREDGIMKSASDSKKGIWELA